MFRESYQSEPDPGPANSEKTVKTHRVFRRRARAATVTDSAMSLAENIRRLRLQKQLTQPALAERAGVSKGYVYSLESGETTNPSLDVLMKIAHALDTTIAELIDEPRTVVRE